MVGVLGVTVYPVTGISPYGFVAFEFTAAGTSAALTLVNDAAGDHTVLVDNFTIAPSSGNWVVATWTGDEDSGVDANFVYTHAYSFGTADSPVINGITFTGVRRGRPAVAGQFSTTYLGNVFNGDNDAALTGGSQILGRDFVYRRAPCPPARSRASRSTGSPHGREYVATIYSVGFDSPVRRFGGQPSASATTGSP